MQRARSTDSNGLAARSSACASTRRTASAPAPRTSIASRSARVTAPDRSAESAMASASSNGRIRAQSTIVRRGVVTPSSTWSSARLAQWTARPTRCLDRHLAAPPDHHLGLRRLDLQLPPVVRGRAPQADDRGESGRCLAGLGRRRQGVPPARALLDLSRAYGHAEPTSSGEAEQLFVDAVPPRRSRARVASMAPACRGARARLAPVIHRRVGRPEVRSRPVATLADGVRRQLVVVRRAGRRRRASS